MPWLMYVKIGLLLAAMGAGVWVVQSYNSAIKDAEKVKRQNVELTKAVKEATQAVKAVKAQSAKNERLSAIQITESDRIEAKEPAVIKIIRTVNDETNCADTRAPDDIIRVLKAAR